VSCGAVLSQSQPWTQPPYRQVQQAPHSRLGVVSFALSLVPWVASITLAVAVAHGGDPSGGGMIVQVIPASATLSLAALVLGIVGLVQKQGGRLFAFLGTAFSGALLAVLPVAFFLVAYTISLHD
jgi:hypothetical protein